MKASELRIGNLVQLHNNECQIDMIDLIGVASIKGLHIVELKYIKPIPLTEEWLLKFGFFMENKSYFMLLRMYGGTKCNYDLIYTKDINCDWYILIDETVKVYLEHVHQLQNLYFALTGEELTLKS